MRLPHTFTILFLLVILIAVLTWVLPAGKFDKRFDAKADREVVVAGTYKPVESAPQGFISVFSSFSKGIVGAAEIVSYLLILGGAYGVILKTGAIDSGLRAAIKKLHGKEALLIPVIMLLFSIGGTTMGTWEETLAFYLIVIPLMIAAGYDAIVGLAILVVGAGTGVMASTLNPFATGIASGIAEVPLKEGIDYRLIFYVCSIIVSITYVMLYAKKVKNNPQKSIVYALRADHQEHFGGLHGSNGTNSYFTFRHKIIITAFFTMICTMVYSIVNLGWWIPEVTMLFLITSMFAAVVAGFKEKEYWDAFVAGSQELLYAALVIGLARAIVVVANDGMIIDTILNMIVNFLSGLPKGLFIILNQLVQMVVAFFIPSSSGHAALTMPVMAPLADIFSVPRSSVITAYQMSSGIVNMITPTAGVLVAAIGMARISWGHWVKFIWPLLLIQTLLAMAILVASIS